jgi:transposase
MQGWFEHGSILGGNIPLCRVSSQWKSTRKVHIPVDDHIYALRNRIERCFNKLKNSRRLATRYDKTMASYLGFVHIAAIRIWMRAFVNKT